MEHKDYVKINAGTAVTRAILDRLGSPDDFLKIIHIAGTNGKGSTAEYFTQILIAAGKKVGTFTSPAVYDFYDQFKIDGSPMPAAVAESYFERALTAADGFGSTDFEIQTAGVLLAFKEEGCEWAVVECGMGGKGDATNAINKKELAVITSISLEHTEYLGDTVAKICVQKAGIIKNCPVVVSGFQPHKEVFSYFEKLGAIFSDGVEAQSCNAATAIAGARVLGLPEKAIREGIKNTHLSGRVEKFSVGGRVYILDGAHNPAAFLPLRRALENLPAARTTLIFGCLKDKDLNGVLQNLNGLANNVIAVPCPNPRTRSVEEVQAACERYFKNVTTAESVSAALDKACTKMVVVCGSFTLLKEAKQWIEKRQ